MMPQIDFSTYIPQIFWFILSFTSIFFISHYLIIPSISSNIKRRQRVIEEILNTTKKNLAKIEFIKSNIHELKTRTYHDNMHKINQANLDAEYKFKQETDLLQKELRFKEEQEINKINQDISNLQAALNQKKSSLVQEVLKAFEVINADKIEENIVKNLEI